MKNTDDVGLLLVRLTLGLVMVVHGSGKLFAVGPVAMPLGQFEGFLASMGVPLAGLVAVVVAVVEFLGGVLLVAGLFTRYAALGVAGVMFGATVLVHLPNGFANSNGGVEFTLVLTVVALSLVAMGPGAYSIAELVFDGEYHPSVPFANQSASS
ncbi:DoxX family protein [Haladaptatus sp. GCM10025707]|uniref:DoxX family protein n=2 Tax=Haladaptatus TaxID=367188 RepID=UPI003610F99D